MSWHAAAGVLALSLSHSHTHQAAVETRRTDRIARADDTRRCDPTYSTRYLQYTLPPARARAELTGGRAVAVRWCGG